MRLRCGMRTERIYVPLEDAQLARLLEASEAMGRTVEELIQQCVTAREARSLKRRN